MTRDEIIIRITEATMQEPGPDVVHYKVKVGSYRIHGSKGFNKEKECGQNSFSVYRNGLQWAQGGHDTYTGSFASLIDSCNKHIKECR